MLLALLKTLHLLAIIVWIGGMVFAHFCLRPAVAELPPPQRLALMQGVLARFFAWVALAAPLAWLSGAAMVALFAKQMVLPGVGFRMPTAWWLMAVGGSVMVFIFVHIRWVLFSRFSQCVVSGQWAEAGVSLAAIRLWVSANLALGVLIVGLVGVLR